MAKDKAKLQTEIKFDLLKELRLCHEKVRRLRIPFSRFYWLERPRGKPPYYMDIENRKEGNFQVPSGDGMIFSPERVIYPADIVLDEALEAATSIWHLNDRIYQWCKVIGVAYSYPDEDAVHITHDLCNTKKHRKATFHSDFDPFLQDISLNMKLNQPIELFYNGAKNEMHIFTSHNAPVTYQLPIYSKTELEQDSEAKPRKPDCISVLSEALDFFVLDADTHGLFSDHSTDVVTAEVKKLYSRILDA
ncbi:MAG: hypothetical protein ACF8GE_02935 [Phycisphaerales bacterium JB043]